MMRVDLTNGLIHGWTQRYWEVVENLKVDLGWRRKVIKVILGVYAFPVCEHVRIPEVNGGAFFSVFLSSPLYFRK